MGSRRDTHGVYRPWYSPQLLPNEGAHGTEDCFLAFVPCFLGDSFFWDGFLVLRRDGQYTHYVKSKVSKKNPTTG